LPGLPATDGSRSGAAGASIAFVRLAPDVDYGRLPADLPPLERADPDAVGEWLASAWSASYRSRVPGSLLLEFDDVATFLFDQASDSDFPAAVELGLLRLSGLHVERFRNRFDLQ
jgi:hypothetical protein